MDMRANMDEMYDDTYEKAMAMAAKVGVAPTAPRVAGRQRHRAYAPAPTAKEYYRMNMAAPFLDHIILQLGERFEAVTVQASRLLTLVPSVMNENQTKVVYMYRTIFHLHSSSRQNFGGGESSMQRKKSSRARVPQP